VRSDLSVHADLFALRWVRDPEAAVAAANALGISEPYAIEVSAWCAEIHDQLRRLADERDVPLLLMGGQGASMRLEAAAKRSSRDNDYLTTATEQDIVLLMDALQARFEGAFPEPLFRYRRLWGSPDAEPLPLATFVVDVPSLLTPNLEVLAVKMEFHIETDAALFPDAEEVEGTFYALDEKVTARLPRLPYQIALKLMTLHEAPVGLNAEYEQAVPRQMWDVDVLAAEMKTNAEFQTLADDAERRYVKEERQRARSPEPRGPWDGVERRLGGWAPPNDEQWRSIEQFQSSQMTRATRRPRDYWAARVARIRLLRRLLEERDWPGWERTLAVERLIPERPEPFELKDFRARVAQVTGAPPKSLGLFPRAGFWEHLTVSDNLHASLDAFESALS
jgi:hypothetical protein